MCLPEAIVIVIVKSKNVEGTRFKYINVRKESRMVARLPQQVLLLLVLVTGATTGNAQRSQLSDWTTSSSNERAGSSSTRYARWKNRNEASSKDLAIDDPSIDIPVSIETTATMDSTILTNIQYDPVSLKSGALSRRKKIKYRRDNYNSHKSNGYKGGKGYFDRFKSIAIDDHDSEDSSIGENRFKSTRTERSLGHRDVTILPSSSIGFKDVSSSYHRKTSSFYTSTSLSLSTIDPTIASILDSSSMQTRYTIIPSYSKATQIESNSINSRNKLGANRQFDPRFPDIPLASTTPFSSQIESLPETSGNNPIFMKIKTEFPKIVKDYEESSKSDYSRYKNLFISAEPKVPSTLIGDSLKKTSRQWPTMKKMTKMPDNEESKLTLAKEQQLEPSTTNAGITPPNFLTTMQRPTQNDERKITINEQRYEGEKLKWFNPGPLQSPTIEHRENAVGFPKRHARETTTDNCEKFIITDDVKREFYSPNYPQNYPPNTNCVRTLEAERGMLLKLDFRDRFELESMAPVNDKVSECRFDYLEVRDGQYGFSNLLGIFCDKNFPPEIVSKSRYLWLRFHSDDTIEYQGFKAVWSTVPRPTTSGVPMEQEPCIKNVTNRSEAIVGIEDVKEEKKIAEQYKVALDCLWIINAPAETKMQLNFDFFKLEKPNDCSANFLDIFDQHTDVPSRLKNFCGSIAESVVTLKNTMYIRFYLEPKAINSSFQSLITVVRDKGSTDKPCNDDEYDCDDATCIAASLKCNNRFNCRFQRDEDATMCGTTSDQFDSSRVIIILVIFSLIMFGMCFAFVFNCVRKLMRDHRIIKEHIRQSRENRLDEIGRKMTPCPVSVSRTDLHDHGSESPSVEVDSSRELIPATSLIARDYAKELVPELKYASNEINDIHQSNNVSNATQERLQESSEELEMCDSSCQTRESLFEPRIPDSSIGSPKFTTFGYRGSDAAQRERSHDHNCWSRKMSQQSNPRGSPLSRHPVSERCSQCISTNSREGSVLCSKHNPIPAPPGWSLHDPPYSRGDICPEVNDYAANCRKKNDETNRPIGFRQNNVGSGERYDSFMRGRESSCATTGSSNVTTSGSQMSGTIKRHQDPRYRAEAVIEVDQKRPFSIESTKSAPDVIATH